MGLSVGGAFVAEFEGVLNDRLADSVIAALEGEGAGAAAGGAGSSIAASIGSALVPVAVLAGSIYTLANVVDGFVNAVEFEGREAVQVGDQTLTPIAEIRLDLEDPFFTNLRDLLQQEGGAQFLQQTGNTLDRPEVRQFIRDEFPELARELFSSRGLQGGEGPQNAQQFLAANNLIRGLTPGQDDQERGVVFDPDAIVDAIEETTAAVMEALPGSEAGAADAAAAAESQRRAESSILDTNVGRARFELGRSTDEGDFESDRQDLIDAINAVHAAEDARIDDLMLGETEITALRKANDLDRDTALGRATTAENTFTTQRIENEMDAAEAVADAAQAKIDGIEAAAEAAMKAADAEAAATERQSIADSNAQRSLLDTNVGRARFELGRAGSENEFELGRQTLLLSIVAVHAAEDARIDDLMLGEIQVAALRKANDLDRDMAIERAIGLENTFTTQRIENEMNAAEAAADAAQARIDGIEEAAAAAMKAAEAEAIAQRRAEAAAEAAAERQRGRESGAAAGLLQSGVGQARFDLGLSGSEGEFEANRIALINATNAFYDNELANINVLDLSEIELDDRRTANELKRQMALSRATTLTNSFTTARIRGEEDAADAAQDAADDVIDAAERAAREQMRIAERAARESQRIAERLADDIEDLRDDALENETDRLQDLEDLNETHQQRLFDIEQDGIRRREDLNVGFDRGVEDILRDAGADESLFRHGDFQRVLGAASSRNQDFLRSELDRLGLNLGEDQFERIGTLAIQRQRRARDSDTRVQRGRADAEVSRASRESDINAQATATATAIQDALTPLFGEQSALSTAQTTAAEVQTTAAVAQTIASEVQTETAVAIKGVSEDIQASDIPSAIDLVRESATASLDVADAIRELPAELVGSFERIIDAFTESGRELIEFADRLQADGISAVLDRILGTGAENEVNAAFGLLSQGIADRLIADANPLAAQEVLDVMVVNPEEIAASPMILDRVSSVQATIEGLRAEGLNNREIGGLVRSDLDALQESGVSRGGIRSILRGETPDLTGIQGTDALMIPAAPEALMQPAPPMPELIANTISVSGNVVNVSGGSGSGGGGAQANPQQPQGNMVAVFNIDGKEVADAIVVPMGDNLAKRQGTRRTVVSGGSP